MAPTPASELGVDGPPDPVLGAGVAGGASIGAHPGIEKRAITAELATTM